MVVVCTTIIKGAKCTIYLDSMVMWRSSQLYSCSFAYTFLSVIAGSLNALNAYLYGKDLTMWSSFLVKATEFDKAFKRITDQKSIFSSGFISAVWAYVALLLKNFFASLTMPETMTKYFAFSLFTLQVRKYVFKTSNCFCCLLRLFIYDHEMNNDDVTML